jgi:hypothetical protein
VTLDLLFLGCRVGLGGCPPRPPTEPYVQFSRIRLFEIRVRYGRQTECTAMASGRG